VRRFAYFYLLPDRTRALELMRIATPRLEHTMVRLAFPLLRRFMSRAMRIDQEHALRSRDKLRSVFDAMSERLGDGRPYLMGDRFGVADLTFAALATPLLTPAEHPLRRHTKAELPATMGDEVRALRETAAGLFALRMYRDHRAS
jgi:glutathione S-transferase